MVPSERELFDLVLIAIGVTALILNSILIIITVKTPDRSRDVSVILGLAVVDMLLPTVAIISAVYNYLGTSDKGRLLPCSVKGPIDFGLLIISIMLVSLTAIQRFARVLSVKIPALVWIAFYGYSISYLMLIFIAALLGEFGVAASGVDCSPSPDKSTFSAVVLTLFGFSFLVYLTITLYCYVRIMIYATTFLRGGTESIELKHFGSKCSCSRKKRRAVVTRTLIMSLIYLLLLAPSGILIMLEANSLLPETESASLAISIFAASIPFANPLLVLFIHAVIYKQLVRTVTNLVSKIIPISSAHQAI